MIKSININSITTKQQFKTMLFNFHNQVNIRKRKPLFNNYNFYERAKLDTIFNKFKTEYINNKEHNRGFTDVLHRKQVIETIEKFIDSNKYQFRWFT